jgi:hypothetical protein
MQSRRWDARQWENRGQARELLKQMRSLPSADPHDPGYRRLRYTRYADDHLLGFTGPKAEAEEIKAGLARFLGETWTAPGTLEALKPGRMQGHGGTEEVPR